MSGNADLTVEETLAITDPGEKDRDQQSWADRVVIQFGNVTAWLFPVLMIAICTQVVIRKMGNNQAWLDDLQWWLYGFAMTVGFGYAIVTQSHVRVDILHHHFTRRKKARIEIVGLGWLLLPFLFMMTDILFHYAWSSVLAREGSDSPNGLHSLYLLKMSLPVLFVLASLATISIAARHLAVIAPVRLWTMLIATLPAALFLAERIAYYVLYWITRVGNPDLNPRRISREPIFDYTLWIGIALVAALFVLSFIRSRGTQEKA
ncbi:MAG: TRAP transporter small permease subunit [Silicimonas sp.]|nr:TRAP transporter small permease subunit [Silicimonas sp.]